MRAALLTFFGIALLGLHQPVHARRGGGGSSGGSSSGSSSDGSSSDGSSSHGSGSRGSGGGSGGGDTSLGLSGSGSCYDPTTSSIGNASDPFDFMYTNQWLYKFVGSYYNGSVEVEAMIDAEYVSCEGQRPVFKQKLDAVLMVGRQLTGLRKPSSNPYMFSIVGWKEGTRPGGTPSFGTNWVSPDARLIYGSISNARSPVSGTITFKEAAWTVTNQKSGNGYSFDAVFAEEIFNMDDSLTILSVSPCNGSQPVDFQMEAYDKNDFMNRNPEEFAQQRTRANGTFDGTSATLSIGGKFNGKFTNWYTRIGESSKSKYGTYKLKFSGNLDRPHSHPLSTSGQTPSWTENRDLLPGGSKAVSAAAAASSSCAGGAALSAGSRAEVGKAIIGLTALGGLVAVGMGIVSW